MYRNRVPYIFFGKKHKFCRLSLKNNLFPKKTGYGQEFFMGLVFKHTAKLYMYGDLKRGDQ